MNPNLTKLPKGWEGILADEYLSGASDVEVRARLRMTPALWDSLMSDPTSSDFKATVDFGRMLSKAWWMSKARKNLDNKAFNANLWFMVMKNQFGWSEKTMTTTKEAVDLSADELDERVTAALAKWKKAVKA